MTQSRAALIDRPIARCVLDLPQPHLDRHFDYAVPDGMSAKAVPGVRVSVRFAGRDVPGYLIDRVAESDHVGTLVPLRRVVSPEPVLTPEILRLCRAVADRYAGSLSDVLRLAVPPRHATTEKSQTSGATPSPRRPDAARPSSNLASGPNTVAMVAAGESVWASYRAGAAFLARLRDGTAPRAVWSALPGTGHVMRAMAEAIGATAAAGGGVVAILPDRRDVDALAVELGKTIGAQAFVRLEADLGPAVRYSAFLSCLRGEVRIAIGTRSAAFAPVRDLGLVAMWDDGDDQYAEPRAPYPHALEVLRLRAEQSGAAALIGGWAMSAEAAQLLASQWARPVAADRAQRRRAWAQVEISDPDHPTARSRITEATWRVMRQALTIGSVLVQVPRSGYVPALACAACRRSARCQYCSGPVQLTGDTLESRTCGWCGRPQHDWHCPHCGSMKVRAVRIGIDRTADELGRAFPGVPVVVSRPERTLPVISERASLVVATPGIEPPAPPGGYAGAILLDGNGFLALPDLRAGESAVRRWLAAAAAVRPGGEGGRVVLSADVMSGAVQAVVRHDPAGFAERELIERGELRLPPAARVISLQGPSGAVTAMAGAVVRAWGEMQLPPVETLGPIPLDEPGPPEPDADTALLPDHDPTVRLVLRTALEHGAELIKLTRAALVTRSAAREPGVVRVQVDPRDLG